MASKIENIVTNTPVVTACSLIQNALQKLDKDGKSDATSISSLQLAMKLLLNLDPYMEECSMDSPEFLRDMIGEARSHDWKGAFESGKIGQLLEPGACAGTYEGNFIAQVARSIGAKRVLEVGMFMGTTTANVAASLPAEGRIVTLENEPYLKEATTAFFEKAGQASKIEVMVGQASDLLKTMVASQTEGFDLIFIDADKTGYQGYYDTIMDGGLLNEKGVMLVDNVLYQGLPILSELPQHSESKAKSDNGKALHKFNRHVHDDSRVDVTVLPIRDGLSWITKKTRQP